MRKQKSDRNLELINNLSEIGIEDKELLMNLSFVSALMEKDKQTKLKAIQKILILSKSLNTSLASILQNNGIGIKGIDKTGNNIYDVETLVNKDIISNINPKDILNMVVEFASNIGFFDSQVELEGLLDKYRTDLQIQSNPDEKTMKYGARDNSYQYLTSHMTPGEIYANLAYLFNKLAHIFDDAQRSNSSSFPIGKRMLDLKKVFMSAKVHAIHEMIGEKAKGEDIKIGLIKDATLSQDNKYSEGIYIALPHYLQPILLHVPKGEISDEEKQICTDKDKFTYDFLSTTENSAAFPLKLTPEKENVLKKLYENDYKRRTGNQPGHVRKLRWFFEDNLSKPIVKSKGSQESSSTKRRLSSSKVSLEEIHNKNKQFLHGISADVGVNLPEYLEEKLLQRASYSFEKFYEKIKTVLEKNNRNMAPDDLEIMAKKIFIDIRITRQISTLVTKGINSEELVGAIDDSALTCSDTINFIREEANNFSDFTNFKAKLKENLQQRKSLNETRIQMKRLLQELENVDNEITKVAKELTNLVERKNDLKVEIDELEKRLKGQKDR